MMHGQAREHAFFDSRNMNLHFGSSLEEGFTTVSLFSGCGGLDLGFTGDFTYKDAYYKAMPFDIIKAYDAEPKCVETYNMYFGHETGIAEVADLSTLQPAQMPHARVLIGGFPCQDFSSCGPKHGLKYERGNLYKAFLNYMDYHRPEVVVAENVLNLKRMDKGAVLSHILTELETLGIKGGEKAYRFQKWVLFAPDYGVPQKRTRLFLIGVRADLPGQPQEPATTFLRMNYRTIEWAIRDLENITDDSVMPNQSQYFKANVAERGWKQGDERSRAGEPAYTVRANAKSRIQFHYKLDRRLTVRECARIQTFPDNFRFPHSATSNIMEIGNAVPPILAYQVAESVKDYLLGLTAKEQMQPLLASVG
ncbi:MAG: DNA (cytosine-5-)-methyltransferase [Candidatus Chloroheliales bacterium]|nr:MAG: DNA (cytosine-5-)-methyltransferase [Chloroflexota bacterium]